MGNCKGCNNEFNVPMLVRKVVEALSIEDYCQDCIGKGIRWAISQSKKE